MADLKEEQDCTGAPCGQRGCLGTPNIELITRETGSGYPALRLKHKKTEHSWAFIGLKHQNQSAWAGQTCKTDIGRKKEKKSSEKPKKHSNILLEQLLHKDQHPFKLMENDKVLLF